MNQTKFTENDPRRHTAQIKAKMDEIVHEARKAAIVVTDPKAKALFETSAEAIIGLKKAYDDYEQHNEAAWKTATNA